MAALLIRDGWMMDGVIPARGPWPSVKFRYRPALSERITEWLQECQAGGKPKAAACVKLLAEQLVSWDVVDEKGELVAITPANLKRVPHVYLEKLLDFVTGYSTPDQQEQDAKN